MAPPIPPLTAVSAESLNRNMSTGFAQSLDRLAYGVRQSGAGARPVEYVAGDLAQVKAAEAIEQVLSANDAVTEARMADRNFEKVSGKLARARELTFQAVNSPEKRLRGEDRDEFDRMIDAVQELTQGSPLVDGNLKRLDPGSFQGSLGAIQVIDRAISEVTDQRGLLGMFQASKLTQIGNFLRDGVAGVVTSNSVIRDRVVAVNLAQSAVAALENQKSNGLLANSEVAGQVLAAIAGRK